MGIPGSGKGTQAQKMVDEYNYAHISTGDLLRNLEKDPNADPADLDKMAQMKSGNLVANDLIYKLAFDAIKKALDSGQGAILDGAIRTVEQAQAYDAFFAEFDVSDDVVAVNLHITDDVAMQRLTQRRVCSPSSYTLPTDLTDEEAQAFCETRGETMIVRGDDNPETIAKRLSAQGNAVLQPILDYYEQTNKLITVDASGSIDAVDALVIEALSNN